MRYQHTLADLTMELNVLDVGALLVRLCCSPTDSDVDYRSMSEWMKSKHCDLVMVIVHVS